MKSCISCYGELSRCVSCLGMSHWHQQLDTVVEKVRQKQLDRSQVGIAKYGVTLERKDLTQLDWLNHAQQEALDLANYLQVLIDNGEVMGAAGLPAKRPPLPWC